MKGDTKATVSAEPVGIVISGFPRALKPTVFWSYEYAPAPTSSNGSEPKAA